MSNLRTRVGAGCAALALAGGIGLVTASDASADTYQWSSWVPCYFSGSPGYPGSSYTYVRWELDFSGGNRRILEFDFGDGATEHITSESVSELAGSSLIGYGQIYNWAAPGPTHAPMYGGTDSWPWRNTSYGMNVSWHLHRSGAPSSDTAECYGTHAA